MSLAHPIQTKHFMEGPSPIRWGAYREGARSQLRRFHSLKREGPALIQAYQDVLDKDETFTQFFSDDRLQSYELESKLRKLLGIRPPLVDEPESPNNQNDASLSWATIIRDGKFEERDDGFFQCRMQGRLIKIDEAMHRTIMVNRCLNPPDKDPWVSAADVKKEYEVNLSIEADVLDELRVQTKYVERLKRLHQSLKKRRYRLQGDQGPAALSSKRSRTPHTLRSKNSSPIDSSLKLSVVSHTAGDSQPESRMSISTEPPGGLMKPTASIETTDARGHSASPSSSDVSTGEDIPFSRDQNSLKRKNLSSDYEETLDEDWPTQHQTPVPRDTSTPLISASKRNKSAAAEEGNKMIDSVGAAAKSRTSVPSNTSTPLASVPRSSEQSAPENSHTIFDGASERNDFPIRWLSEAPSALYSEAPSPLYPDNDEMEIDKQTQSPKPMAPTQRAKQPTPKHETPRKSKRALNGAASSLRQEYENAGQLIDLTSSPASNPASVQEAMQLGLEMAGWQGDFTPVDLRPKAASTKTKTKSRVKEQKKGTRVRNNFTQEECDHAPAWLKPRLAAGISPAQLEQDYEARFGVLHRYNTLKHWLERQEAKSGTILSKIVPTPEPPSDRVMPPMAVPSFRPINPPPYVSPYPHPLSTEPTQASLLTENMPSSAMPPSAKLPTPKPAQESSLTKTMPSSVAHSTLSPAQSSLLTGHIPQSAGKPTQMAAQSSSSTEIMPSSAAHTKRLSAQNSSLMGNMPQSPERSTSMPTQRSSSTENRPFPFQRSTPMPNGLPKTE